VAERPAGTVTFLAIAERRDADAEALPRESFDLALRPSDRDGLSWYPSQQAVVLVHEGRGEDAGRVWGAVDTAAVFLPDGPWPRDVERRERELNELADDAFERGREAGRSLALEDVAASMLARGRVAEEKPGPAARSTSLFDRRTLTATAAEKERLYA
jgi:hypothetical protein